MHEQLLGKPWKANAVGPDAFDCWGLVRFWYREELQIDLPSAPVSAIDLRAVVYEMEDQAKGGSWTASELGEANQLVAMGKNRRLSHVGIHIGGGFVLHCSRESGVTVNAFSQLQRRWSMLKTYTYTG